MGIWVAVGTGFEVAAEGDVGVGIWVAVGTGVEVAAEGDVGVGIWMAVGGTEVALFASVIAVGSSEPPQPTTANNVKTIASADNNLTIECVLVLMVICSNISQGRRL